MKKIFLLIICCSWLLNLSAQFDYETATRFGVKAGGLYGLMNFNAGSTAAGSHETTSWKNGYYLGGLLQIPVSSIFTIQPEYMYKSMPGQDNVLRESYNMHYLSLPVLLRVAVLRRFAFVAGPEFALLIHATRKVNGTVTRFTHETEERSVSAVGGLEANISSSFYVNARYLHGYNNVGLYQRLGAKEFKWRTVEVGIDYRW